MSRPPAERADDRARGGVRRGAQGRRRRLGRLARRLIGDPGRVRAAALRASRRSPTRSTRMGMRYVAPGIGPTHGVRWPLLAAVARGFRHATRRRPPDRSCSSPTACSASPTSKRAGSRSACSSGRWPTSPSGPGSCSAARARGRRLDHRRRPRPPVRPRHRRRAVPLGGARAARLLAVTLGAPARRLDDRDDDPRTPTGSVPGDRPDRPAAPRPADGRRRAGRPEGARLGVSARSPRDRPRRHDRGPAPRDRAPWSTTTATVPGSSATPCQARPGRRRRPARATRGIRKRAGRPIDLRRAATAAAGFGALPDPSIPPRTPLADLSRSSRP